MSSQTPDQPTGEEQRGRDALRRLGTELEAPPRLRARIEAERERADHASRRWPVLGAVGAGLAAAVIAVVVLTAGGAPTVDETAELAALPASEPAPVPQPGEPTLLAADVEGVAFPNWESEFGWRATGSRTDEVEGRKARTVVYEKEGNRVAYTIVSGDALEVPEGGATTTVDGVEFTSFTGPDGDPSVTWLREGHTCVLSGDGVSEESLVELAAWKGDGAVAF